MNFYSLNETEVKEMISEFMKAKYGTDIEIDRVRINQGNPECFLTVVGQEQVPMEDMAYAGA